MILGVLGIIGLALLVWGLVVWHPLVVVLGLVLLLLDGGAYVRGRRRGPPAV